MRVAPPTVAVMVSVEVPAGVPVGDVVVVVEPDPQADNSRPANTIITSVSNAGRNLVGDARTRIRILPAAIPTMMNSGNEIGARPNGTFGGAKMLRAVVMTVTVNCAALTPFTTTGLGFIVQDAAAGAPEQVKDTLPVNPVGAA